MELREILVERSLADVGVRGGKFYLAGRGENIDMNDFVHTGHLPGVQGISSTKYIWADFGPHIGRDLFFVMNANDVLRMNKVVRVGYDNAEKMIANNSKLLGRIMNIVDVSKGPCDNLITGVFAHIPGIKTYGIHGKNDFYKGDYVSVQNMAQHIAWCLQKGRPFNDKIGTDSAGEMQVDEASFGGKLNLSTIDDYAHLYYEASKGAGWYGKPFVKFFAPQNRSQWYPAISAAIIAQAAIYANEEEWINKSDTFTVPPSTLIIFAVPKDYMDASEDNPARKRITWNKYDDQRMEYYQNVMKMLQGSQFRVNIVEAGKASNTLIGVRSKASLKKNG